MPWRAQIDISGNSAGSFGDRRVYDPFVIRQMAAKQRAVHFADGAFAELPAERGVGGFVAGHHHQPGRAEIRAVHQRAAGEDLYQTVVYRVEILRILPDRLSSPAGLLISTRWSS